jgi:uncharacterized protein YggT (Ycf19 family)
MSSRTRMVVLLVWTVGLLAVWLIARDVLNAGVSDDAIQECVEEGFIPPSECENALEDLESDDRQVLSVGLIVLVWAVGLPLLWVMTRPTTSESDLR